MIEIHSLDVRYGATPVLKDISLAVPRGQITTLIGPNGCGKTTLLRACARLIPHVRGDIRLDDRPIADYGRTEFARRMAFLPQSRPVPALRVRELVEQGRYPHLSFSRQLRAADHAAVEQELALTHTKASENRDVRTLSGGERQRVYIAMALSQGADVILLDEPTTYLDLRCQFEVLDLMRTLNAQGKTFMLVLHDLAHALMYSDQVVLMQDGRIVCAAPPRELLASGKIDEVMGVRTHLTPDGQPYFTPLSPSSF